MNSAIVSPQRGGPSDEEVVEVFRRSSPRVVGPRPSSLQPNYSSPGIKSVGTEDTLTIHHVNSTTTPDRNIASHKSTAVMSFWSKPILLTLMAAITLSGLGAGVWGFLTIPGLYDQIEELETQVDRLTGQVDRLEVEVTELADQVDRLENLSQDLNTTVDRLEENIEDMHVLNQKLANETDRLKESNTELLEIVDTLNGTVSTLIQENDRLQHLNSNLEVIVSFLNETSLEISDTLDSVTEYLAQQIVANQHILLETLENTFTGQINNWDCAFQDVFQFTSYDTPIAPDGLEAVLDYVDGRVLHEFCADREDFVVYLDSIYGLESLSVNNLLQGVAVYTTANTNYFFPNPGQSGLTTQEWAKANYNCLNVPKFSIFNG